MVFMISRMQGDDRYGSIQARFKNFVETPEGGGYDAEHSRFLLVFISLDTFRKHPLFGCGGTYLANSKMGGHQALFDFLALYGILGGGGAFVMFVIHCMANAGRRCQQDRNWRSFTAFAGVGIFVVVGIVNPGWIGGPMTTLLLFFHPYRMPTPRYRQPLLPSFEHRAPSAQTQ